MMLCFIIVKLLAFLFTDSKVLAVENSGLKYCALKEWVKYAH